MSRVSVEDISIWSEADLETNIRRLLDAGQVLVVDSDGLQWTSIVETGDGSIIRAYTSFDRRHSLLELFGWLWLKSRSSSGGTWNPHRRELTRESVTGLVHGSKYREPPDIDPKVVQSVYSSSTKAR